MPAFTKESLETLRQKINLVDLISSHITLKKQGGFYRARCPFHEEKTPSFVIQSNDSHYHCFGCQAHGDAIQFLMNYLKMSFVEAVEHLAERFHVSLEQSNKVEEKGPSKLKLREALEKSCRFYQYMLFHSHEGQDALSYLYSRGIDLEYIRMFQIGFAPKVPSALQRYMREFKIEEKDLKEAGLVTENRRDFFSDRIMIPITDALGRIIGYSARKFKESTFGPKYINTPETPLFKKSKVLFGLSFCRKRIAKEKRVIIVEGQLDALRLIYSGFQFTVAGQGTAFGNDHVQELINLGVKNVYLAMDADKAGIEASIKVGDLFQKEGIEVKRLALPEGLDPDSFIKEKGPDLFEKLINSAQDYLTFLISEYSKNINMQSPAHKADLVQRIASQIQKWDHPLMVHESLRKLARLTQTPESMLANKQTPNVHLKKSANLSFSEVNADRVLEADLLRWLFLMANTYPHIVKIAQENLTKDHFKMSVCKNLFESFIKNFQKQKAADLLSIAIDTDGVEEQLFLAEMLQKKVDKEKAENLFIDTVQKILDRNWMEKREEIKERILSGKCSEEEALALAKKFDEIKKQRPVVKIVNDE
ncbi:MAG: DNA primase [Chlamydiae bacterium CG10_big_fil_rev_8_21_14_0_10_35_9]|nr:MAG: DNA primase [Chlamydiae bacterium CG10_big_fil_rev_8_21_14_0_10_35_9]